MNRHLKTFGQKGFTLVELAIVITIIGILIGGVLKGQQLIKSAETAALISQVNDYKTAHAIFKSTYREYPGDMIDPDSRIVGCNGCVADGTEPLGDGYVGNREPSIAQTDKGLEPVRYWLHMMKANMITGVTDAALTSAPLAWGETHPAIKMGGGFHAKSGTGGCGHGSYTNIWAGGCYPVGLTLVMQKTLDSRLRRSGWLLTPLQAATIDRRLDDGKAATGWVRAAGGSLCQGGGPNADSYDESGSSDAACNLGFVIDD